MKGKISWYHGTLKESKICYSTTMIYVRNVRYVGRSADTLVQVRNVRYAGTMVQVRNVRYAGTVVQVNNVF